MRSTINRMSAALALLMALAGAPVLAQDDDPVRALQGAVNIIAPDIYMTKLNASEEMRMIAATTIEPGETLRTDEYGVALVTWYVAGAETVLGADSALVLHAFSGTSFTDFVLDVELVRGHFVGGLGEPPADTPSSRLWTLRTPAYTVRPLSGHFELDLDHQGEALLVVIEGEVEVTGDDGESVIVRANEYVLGAPGAPQALTADGVTPQMNGVCTVTAETNLNVRHYASEESRRLGGVTQGQVMWVRSVTEGNLWLQVYFQTDLADVTTHNSGWIYGPAGTLDEAACETILRAPLDARLYGGPGVGRGTGQTGETGDEQGDAG